MHDGIEQGYRRIAVRRNAIVKLQEWSEAVGTAKMSWQALCSTPPLGLRRTIEQQLVGFQPPRSSSGCWESDTRHTQMFHTDELGLTLPNQWFDMLSNEIQPSTDILDREEQHTVRVEIQTRSRTSLR